MGPFCSLPVYFLEPLGSFDQYTVFFIDQKKKSAYNVVV